ncbi:hypothetical protein BY996DRAFT_6827124 [Phakopsora pachyrhizi]|uniref:Transmembrane 9 superfamily member n=1 Tax=Phakopsora pachyrhizi TaxID=170000 RepID=A0AAV0BG35_PHAPC|nr:hypothetical protein BY996DRAFT_6827124 [Phakopsora pachyrhizi]CAH7686254.1 hypothetical protein PPACK8108_LOCUS20876 [Phakopsora pachyrhizi]
MMDRDRLTTKLYIFLLLSQLSLAFYLPGAAPRDYNQGDLVPLFVNALTPQLSSTSQLKSVISYNYYHPQLHFCQPDGGPQSQRESFGSILFGDRIYSSPFEIKMKTNETCKRLCQTDVPAQDATFVNQAINDHYAFNWLVDGLPAAELKRDDRTGRTFYSIGFALGLAQKPTPALHNHYNIFLEYHERDGKFRVVGALVWPASLDAASSEKCDIGTSQMMRLSEEKDNPVTYTYNVIWTESTTPWATRWDNYLHIFDPKIHWFSLVNSIVIVIFLCVMVGMILIRTVSRDIGRYNAIDQIDDVQEDFGWKLIHGEVFRAPEWPMLLAVAVGSGSQLLAMIAVTLVFALFGFLSPANRGSISTVMIVTWTLFSYVAGYVSTRVYQTFGGYSFKKNIIMTACLFPSALFAGLNVLNFFLIASRAAGAVPFGTMIAIISMWFLISVPLTVFGSIVGSRKGQLSIPVRVNQIPRQIPPAIWYMRFWPSALMAGILPFGAGFIECYFLLSSLFGSKVYYAAGFLFLTFGVVGLTTATVTVLMCYFHLCQEDYRWHERAFVTGGASAFWLVAYGLIYATRLSLDGFTSIALYVGYLTLIALLDFLMTGAIGYIATLFFVRKIYSRIRID